MSSTNVGDARGSLRDEVHRQGPNFLQEVPDFSLALGGHSSNSCGSHVSKETHWSYSIAGYLFPSCSPGSRCSFFPRWEPVSEAVHRFHFSATLRCTPDFWWLCRFSSARN